MDLPSWLQLNLHNISPSLQHVLDFKCKNFIKGYTFLLTAKFKMGYLLNNSEMKEQTNTTSHRWFDIAGSVINLPLGFQWHNVNRNQSLHGVRCERPRRWRWTMHLEYCFISQKLIVNACRLLIANSLTIFCIILATENLDIDNVIMLMFCCKYALY